MHGPAPLPAAIALTGVSLSFGGLDVLRDVDVSAARGEVVGLIGPNGAGKSSLLNVMSGFYRAGQGKLSIGGAPVSRPGPHRVARAGVVRTFQNLGLFAGMSVLDNVLAGQARHGKAGWASYLLRLPSAAEETASARAAAFDALDALNLTAFAHVVVSALPYGVQKRVELCRALAGAPDTLLLDEPLAGMNAAEKEEMAAAIRTVNATRGTTILLIEHDIGIVMQLADRLVVLDRGRKIADGPPARVAADPIVIAAYLGTRPWEDGDAILS